LKTIYKGTFDISVKTREQMISSLKKCRVMIGEEGKPIFSYNYCTWNLENKDINLIRGADDLMWDIFCNSTKDSSFFYFRESTIPSARCHPETVAVIEKIKNDCFKDPRQIIRLIDDFKVVRMMDESFLKNKHTEIEEQFDKECDSWATWKTIKTAGIVLGSNLVAPFMVASPVL
jgi:hypothetical protein